MTSTRWLSDREQAAWRSYLTGNRVLFGQLEREMQEAAGLPLAYYEILSVLSEVPECAARMSDLAAALQVSVSRLSHAVSRMEAMGLLERRLCASDRRGWLAVLTEQGLARLQAVAPLHVEGVRRHLFDQLSPEQVDEMQEIGQSILRNLCRGK